MKTERSCFENNRYSNLEDLNEFNLNNKLKCLKFPIEARGKSIHSY